MAPRSVTNVPTPTAPTARRQYAPVEERPAPPPVRQDSYTPSDVVGQVVMLPINAVFFVGNASLMTAKLLIFQVAHPFQLDIPRVLRWLHNDMQGEVPTTDPDLLALLIRTQNPGFADQMTGYLAEHPAARPDVVAVMRWAIATQGKGMPPTNDPRLLGKLIATQNADFAHLMMGFLDAHPQAGSDVTTVLQWAIRTRGKGAPQTNNVQLLGALIATQNAPVANALLAHAKDNSKDVAKIMRWALETHGKGMPPTEDPKLLATLIATQEPKFGKLLQDFLKANPTAGRDVLAVERWAIQTRGKGVPPTHHAKLLATLIATQEPTFGKLLQDFLRENPNTNDDVADVARWAIETRGKGMPPTQNPKLLATLIGTQNAGFAKLMQDYLASHPQAGAEVARVERWAIGTKGVGTPPTEDPALLATLIGTQEPAVATMLLKHVPRCPAEVAKVAKWAIATHGQGEPPTTDARLLASLIGLKVPALAADLDAYLVKHPQKAADVAAIEKWLITSQGKPKGLPPRFTPGVLLILLKYVRR